MADIDQDPFGSQGVRPDLTSGEPLNDAGAIVVIRGLLETDDFWTRDDMLREGNFTKLMSFVTREGIAYQLYLQDQQFVLGRFDTLNVHYQWMALPAWATNRARWVVQGLVEYGLSTWGV
jgi:hypothetical protein